MKGKGKAVHLL